MAVFKRTFQPIEAEIENVKGEVVKLISEKTFTVDVTEELEKLGVDTDGKTGSGMIVEQMMFVFGKDKDFYKQFEISVLFNVIQWVSEQIYQFNSKKK